MSFKKIKKLVTIDRFISEQEDLHPGATGEFTSLMHDFNFAIRMISHQVRRAGINDILGLTDNKNVHGEQIKKIDQYANDVIIQTMQMNGSLRAMISEEHKEVIEIPGKYPKGKYILAFDPLDGSTNIDVNITIGTIFSLYKTDIKNTGKKPSAKELLQPGNKQVAAGYVLYGSSTMLVYTTGNGVNVFTLDPDIGEFIQVFENVKIPKQGFMYSCNEGNYYTWEKPVRDYLDYIKTPSKDGKRPYNFRYVASAVADIHRMLHNGGIYLYPAGTGNPKGKIRLLYEANPLAMIVEQAGGKATTGAERILDILPNSIHDTVPFFIGSPENIDELEKYLSKEHR